MIFNFFDFPGGAAARPRPPPPPQKPASGRPKIYIILYWKLFNNIFDAGRKPAFRGVWGAEPPQER